MASFGKEPFNPQRGFRTTKSVTLAGRRFAVGEELDKTLLPERRLRQLYDQRYVQMEPRTFARPAAPSKPDFAAMTEAQVRTWLVGRGVVPHPRAKLQRLVERAEQAWAAGEKRVAAPTEPAPQPTPPAA